ncbi:MAG: DNA repair protein RadC [Chlamydiia bacterium]|nr:DNA repair protein RadC [Chlamydiia bacterium]
MTASSQTHYRIQALPESERPRERLRQYGAEALSSAELLAIILGSGMRGKSVLHLAHEIVAHFGDLEALAQASLAELCALKGVGDAKALQIAAVAGLGRRLAARVPKERVRIQTPTHAYQIVREELENETREKFLILLLDTKAALIKTETIAIGTLNEVLVHPRELFLPAIRHSADSIILAHNHPSGDCTPSNEDLILTKKIVDAGHLLEIQVQDHLIVGRGDFTSLRQRGVKF